MMRSIKGLSCFCLVLFVFVQSSQQCTCDWRQKLVEGVSVPNVLCYPDDSFIEFTTNDKRKISGSTGFDWIDGRMEFDVTVSKLLQKNGEVTDFPEGRSVTLSAPLSGSLCGYIDFQKDVTYYLSIYGELRNKISFNACDYGRRIENVPDVHRKLMTGELACPQDQDPYW